MRAINKDDFQIITTPAGNVKVCWKHNKARLRLFRSDYNPLSRAHTYRDWLIKWYAENNYLINDDGQIKEVRND